MRYYVNSARVLMTRIMSKTRLHSCKSKKRTLEFHKHAVLHLPGASLSHNFRHLTTPSPRKQGSNGTFRKMVWSQEEIDAFKARRAQGEEGHLGKVDDYVSVGQGGGGAVSPTARASPVRKWKPTAAAEKSHVTDWIGGSPTAVKRSWKVKSPTKSSHE